MLWVGTTELEAEDVHKAPLQGLLAKDWACAMPIRDTVSPVALPVCTAPRRSVDRALDWLCLNARSHMSTVLAPHALLL